jgi:hypothetical protein
MEGHFGAQTQDALGGNLSAEPVDNDGPGLLREFNTTRVFSAQRNGYLDRKRDDCATCDTLCFHLPRICRISHGCTFTVEKASSLKSPESLCLPLFNVLEKSHLKN